MCFPSATWAYGRRCRSTTAWTICPNRLRWSSLPRRGGHTGRSRPSTCGSPLTTVPELETPSPPPIHHPVRMRVTQEFERRRLTVFFRLLLLIPHFIWLGLWGFVVILLSFVNWIVILIKGRAPEGLHRMLAMYVNYATHVYAYGSIAANRFPGFIGEPGYEVDIIIDPAQQQSRLKAFFRL